MAYSRELHLRNEYNTRDLICYIMDNYNISNHKQIFGLIRFTWLGDKAKLDGYNIVFEKKHNSLDEVIVSIKDAELRKLFSRQTGFTNFYKAYRNTAFKWAEKNYKNLGIVFNLGLKIQNDYDIIKIAKYIETLPSIPKANYPSIKMTSESLLTPFLACIDPTNRTPIVNKNHSVRELHQMMGITNLSLSEKTHDLLEIMTENKIKDSLFLDVYCKEAIKKKIIRLKKEIKKVSKELLPKDDSDVKYIITENRRTVVRNHRKLEKILLSFCQTKNISIEEGIYSKLKYDALIRKYKNGRDLLIEIKGSSKISEIRLAIGQVLDYGYEFKNGKTDLAIFLPTKPESKYLQIAKSIDVNVLWLEGKRIAGTINL